MTRYVRSVYHSPLKLEDCEMDLDYLPEPKIKPYNKLFTPEIDEAIIKYWPIKQKETLAKALGICVKTIRKRYAELTNHAITP